MQFWINLRGECEMFIDVFLVLLCLGVKESTVINNVLTVVNLGLIAYVIICGLFKVDIHNWEIPKSEVMLVTFDYPAVKLLSLCKTVLP
jgi:amino acid transporter